MKRRKNQRLVMSIMAGFLALLMILPILANVFLSR